MNPYILSLFLAFASPPAETDPSDAAQESSIWQPGSEFTARGLLLGYEPSKIVSEGGPNDYDADDEASMIWDAKLRVAIRGRYLHMLLEPYAIIPSDVTKVNVAGLEATFLAPIGDSVRTGLYHHSSHNFGDGDYGFGTDLNAVVLDIKALHGDFPFWDETWDYGLRTVAHYYFTRMGPANVFTEDTEITPDEVGRTRWRMAALLDVRSDLGRSDCDLSFKSSRLVPASMSFLCSARFRLGMEFFGAIGDHLCVGPYVSYNRNFTRVKKFGADAFSGGIRLDLLFQEIDWES